VFKIFIELSPIKKFNSISQTFFVINSNGMQSNRDNWVYGFSKKVVEINIKRHIKYYNTQVDDFIKAKNRDSNVTAEEFKNNDPTKISWSSSLVFHLEKNNKAVFENKEFVDSMYRPFTRQILYKGDKMIHRRGQFEMFFPYQNTGNVVVCVGNTNGPSVLMTKTIADSNYSGYLQGFPLYYYEQREKQNQSLFDEDGDSEFIRRDGVSDFIIARAQKMYGKRVSKEDIFYYVYGFLHSPEYKKTFANDLKKMLPRIPLVDEPANFWKFSKAGRDLAELHVNYESVPPYKGVTVKGAEKKNFKVQKMRFPSKGDKDRIIYNSYITIEKIPAKAYEYVVNGKSAIEWIMERYQITTHKESGITNDPNDWAEECGNPRYILDLLLSIINVSMQTLKIVEALPEVKFE